MPSLANIMSRSGFDKGDNEEKIEEQQMGETQPGEVEEPGFFSKAADWVSSFLTPTQIGNGYRRPFDDSVYTDIPGTPTADGQFGQLEDDAVRQARMDAFNNEHPYISAAGMGATQGFASVMGGMQSALGGGTSILDNTDKFNEATQKYRDKWNQEYGDNYFTNPNGLVTDVSNGLGSSVPIMALSALMPGGAVAAGSARLTQALTRAGLGRFATSKIGQELIANTVRSPLSTFADSASEMGGVIHDKVKNGADYGDAWASSIPVFAKNAVLDTLMLPTELTVMKGAKGLNLGPLGAKAGEGIGKRLAKGAARGTILAGANGLTEGFQEAEQQAIEDNAKGGDLSYNPYYWNDDQWKAFRGGAVGGAVMGAPGNFIEGYRGAQETPGITGQTRQEAVDILNGIRNNDDLDAKTKQTLYNAAVSNDEGTVHAAYTTLQNMQNGKATAQSVFTEADMPEEYKKKQQAIGNFIDNNTADSLGDDTYNTLYNATTSMNPDEIDKAYTYVTQVEAQQKTQAEAAQRAQQAAQQVAQQAEQARANAERDTSSADTEAFSSGFLQDTATQIANANGIDPAVFRAMINKESTWDPSASNDVDGGHYGLGQLSQDLLDEYGVTDWQDPVQNMTAAAKYLKSMLDRYDGNYELALAAYNAGPGNVDEAGGVPNIGETQDYVSSIMGAAGNDSGETSGGVQPYDLPTQGPDIDDQVANLTPQFRSALPTIGGILNEMGLADGAAISSGTRTPEHNAEVGGAENSYHVHNDAVDIVLPEGTTEEQAQEVLQRFKDTGAFKEVLFHDAGSGYHLHLGGYNGGLNNGKANTSELDETGSRDHSDTEMSDADTRQTSAENDAQLRQESQEMNDTLKAPDTDKIAGDVQREQQAAAQQAQRNTEILQGNTQETESNPTPNTNQEEYRDLFNTANEVLQTTKNMPDAIRFQLGQAVKKQDPITTQNILDYMKRMGITPDHVGSRLKTQPTQSTPQPITLPSTVQGGSNTTPTELIKPAQDAEQQHIDANTTNNNTVAQPQAVTEQPTPGQQAYLNKKEKLITLVPALESAFKALEAEAKKPNPQDARFGSVEDARKAALEAAGITSPREVLTDEDIAKTGIDPNEEAKLQFHFIDQSDEALQQAKEAFKKELNNLSANPMFNPTLMYYGLKIGAIHMQRGANKFADWAANMVADMPETRPFLQSIWNTLQHLPKNGTLNEKEMTAYMRYVGAQYDHGMTDKTDLRRDFIKTLGVAKAKYFESAYEAVMNYPTTEEINAAKGDNSNVHGNAGNVAERTGQGNNQDTVGTNDENQRPTGRNGQGGGTTASGQEEHLQGSDSVSGSSTTTGGTTGNRAVQEEKSADSSGGTGNPQLSRSVTDSYEGNPDDAGRRPEDVVAAAQDGRNDATADDIKAEESAAQETDDSERLADVRKELPQLLPEQAGDVVFAEKRLLDANGNGVMFTNGTGTGKTYTGLGVAKRFYNRGKKNILIIAPSNDIIKQWKDAAAKDFAMPLYQLEGKQDAGKGPTITTFANVGDNQEILKRHWDAVLVDESHNLMNSESGNVTKPLRAVRAMSRHPEGFQRYFDAVYAKETRELNDAYKVYEQANTYNAKNTNELKRKYDELKGKYKQLKEKAKQDYQGDTKAKVVFLSATPFAYVADVDYANGYLFDYGDKQSNGYNDPSAYSQFFIENFGYRMRYNKLTKPDTDVDNSVMERQFHDKLVVSGALHGRVLTSRHDYDRGFILVDGGVGKSIDEGFDWLSKHREFSELGSFIQSNFTYHKRMYLLEAIKAKQSIPLIKQYLQHGKKVVVFHDYKKGGSVHPFKLLESDLRNARDKQAPWDSSFGEKLWNQYQDFKRQRPDLVNLNIDGLQSPIELLSKELGNTLAVYNGDISKKDRAKAKNAFNDDNGKIKVILVQSDAGQAGISLHDTTGKYQRVEINLGLPTRPVAAIQEEGRIYRVGNKSNAIFRYLNTGTMMEQMAFATKIAERASTAENLALGEQARSLKNAFINAFNESQEGDSWRKYLPGSPTEGTGGKAIDYEANNALTDYDRAKSFYFAQQKKTSRNKAAEGVDYFATPEPLGLKMVEWAGLKEGESALEPSAGHGAIARWFPENTKNTVVEPSGKLIPKLKMTTPNAKTVGSTFEDFNLVNKFNGIVMNPPFGHGGKTAIDHLAKAFKHLSNGGRIVAIIPEGPSTQKHFDKWLNGNPEATRKAERGEEDAVIRGIIHLPKVTFGRAGTSVPTKVVIIDKYENPAVREEAAADDMGELTIQGNTIKEFFDNLENVTVPDRVDQNRKFSVTEARNAKRRSVNALKEEIKNAFPTATIEEGENSLTMTMPNGQKVVADFRNNIVATGADLARAKEEHGYDINTDVVVEGYAETHGQDAYIALSEGSREGTGFHEAFHVAHDAVLTDKEKALLEKHVGNEEAQADHYAAWVEARQKGRGTAWGKLWQKIKDFARKMQAVLTGVENVHNVLRKIESGDVWNRTGNESNTTHASLSPKRQLQEDIAKFSKVVDDFVNGKLASKKAINIMTTPLVMKLAGAEVLPIKIDYSILRKILSGKHSNEITPQILKQLPKALTDPLMIIKSSKENVTNEMVVVVDVKDTNGATIIVPMVLNIQPGKSATINKVMSVYGKGTPNPNNRWIINKINNNDLLYINKKRTAHWMSNASVAPNGYVVNGSFNLFSTIPDETDLVKLKKANPAKYSVRPQEEQDEELKDIVRPQDIIDAINDIVPIYEKSKVKPDDTGDKLYNEHSGAGFSGSYFNLVQYGRILAMHIDKTLKLKGNRELTKEVIARYDKGREFDSLFSRKDDKNLTPAEARREGVSEFGSTLLENPELGAERYPAYANQFYTELAKNKELKDKFDKVMAMIKAYQEQTVEQRASANISRNGGRIPDRKRDGMKKWLSYQLKNFYTKMVDDTNPLGKMVKQAEAVAGEKIAYEHDVQKQALMAKSNAVARTYMLLTGGKDKKTSFKLLNEIYKGAVTKEDTMQDVLDEMDKTTKADLQKAGFTKAEDALGTYLVAMRTEELVKRYPKQYTRPAGFSAEECQQIIRQAPESIKKAAEHYWNVNTNLINIMQQQGLITKELGNKLRSYKYYCPMYRDMTDGKDMDAQISELHMKGGFVNVESPVKLIDMGGQRAVLDPVNSMIRYMASAINRCERNNVGKSLVRLDKDFPGLGEIVVRDPTMQHANSNMYAFTVWVGGKKVVYRTTPEIYKALTAMNEASSNFFLEGARQIAQCLRRGATISPSFIVRNFLRDTMAASVNSKTGFIPIVSSVKGAWKLATDKKFATQYYGSGASMSTYIRSDVQSADNLIHDMLGDKYKDSKAGIKQIRKLIHKVWNKYDGFANLIEDSTRAAEFAGAMKKGLTIEQAGYLAKEVTLNFGRAGSEGRKYNRYVPFFNATIQGTDKFIRCFKENPKRTIMATMFYIVLPSLVLWAFNHDDDWYKDLDEETKLSNWCIGLGGEHLLIPKPQEVGILFGGGVEAVLNQMMGEDLKAMSSWARQVVQAMTPSLFPAVFRPIIEWMTNYSFWTGRPLVSQRLQNLPSEQQANQNTSEISRLLADTWPARKLKMSPIALDNFISGYFGSAGRFIASSLDGPLDAVQGKSRPAQPAKYLYEMPFIGSFVRQDGANSEYVNRLYDLDKAISDAENRGDKKPKGKAEVDAVMKTVKKLNKEIRAIQDNPKMGAEQKRQEIDKRRDKMRGYAKKAVTNFGKYYE